jgi:hypothetical protein
MKRTVKIIAVILLLSVLFSLSSCGGEPPREYNEAEVISEAKRLIKLSAILNEIYYGVGMRYEEEGGLGAYKHADKEWLATVGITTVEDLKEKTKLVFSEKYSETIFKTVLSPITEDDGTILQYARYYQETGKKGEPLSIMVFTGYDYFLKNSVEYGDNVTVVEVEGQIVRVSIPITLTKEDGEKKSSTLTVDMIEEAAGWRLASATYAIYNDSTDRYEELINGSGK